MVKFVRRYLNVYYYCSLLRERRLIEDNLKVFIPGCEYSPLFRSGKWDGYFRMYDKRLSYFKYGMFEQVKKLLTENEIDYKIVGDFKPIVVKKSIDTTMTGNWRHQKEAIKKFFELPYGTFKIPTRGGKTKIYAEIIRLAEPEVALFVVDNQVLFEQALDDISGHLNIDRSEIGVIREDNFILKNINVAMIQTMQSLMYGLTRFKKNKKRQENKTTDELKDTRSLLRDRITMLKKFLATVTFLTVDEVHEYSSDQRFDLLQQAKNGNMYLFMSAEPNKSEKPVENIKLKRLRGETIYEIAPSVLRERGVLADEQVLLIYVDHETNNNIILDELSTYADYEREVIIQNERRNNITMNVIEILRKLDLKTLVLFNKIEHGKNIQKVTGDNLLTNEVKVENRIKTKNEFLRLKGGVLLATNIFNKGITLPEVKAAFIAGGGLEQSKTIQQKGRSGGVTRTKKKNLVIDFIDDSKYFNQHSLNRIDVYKKNVGINNIFIYDAADEDFYQDIREFLSVWKRG